MQNVLSDEELAALQAAAAESFNQILRGLMTQLMSADPSPSGSSAPPPVRYAEVVARDGARFDCRQGMDLLPLASLLRPGGLAAALVPLLRRVLGEDAEVCQVGQIIAMTEEDWEIIHEETDTFADQKWHTDGRNSANDTDALTVFIPLVDVTPTNGATEFVLGSHAESSGGAENDDERSARATPLLVPAGSAIAFDYRTWHRGLRNCGEVNRPVLYAIVGRPVWRDGLKGLPHLDGGSASLFGGEEVPPRPGWSLRATEPAAPAAEVTPPPPSEVPRVQRASRKRAAPAGQ